MGCDYLVETALVIEFYSTKGEICKIVTNTKRKKGFLYKYNEKSEKYVKKLEKKMWKNCYTKTIYENKIWTRNNYQEKYETKLKTWFPRIDTFIKIYKDSISWPVKSICY